MSSLKRIGIFDTETTGLIKNRLTALSRLPEVIEFYLGVYSPKGKLIEEMDQLIKPLKPITDEITGMNHIDNAMVAKSPSFLKVAPKIKALIEGCDRIVAHNAAFDRDMIEVEMERAGLKVNWPPILCTIEQSQPMTGARQSLTNLHRTLFGEGFDEAHRASKDVGALARCYFELVKRGYIVQ